MPSYLQIENISKSYGPKVLFENIAFNINEGDKIALIAPNGTGKTSLLRILAGEDKSDSGGRIIFLKDISIAFLEQDYSYDPTLSISEQIHAHAAPHLQKMHEDRLARFEVKLAELSGTFRLGSLSRRMDSLSGGEVKRVALCEMLALEAEFFIMDEPTTSLTEPEIQRVFAMMRTLKEQGVGIIFISHKLGEVMEICDRYTVLRDGCMVAQGLVKDTNSKKLAEYMVGHEIRTESLKRDQNYGDEMLRLENLSDGKHFRDISLSVRAGQVLGITGLLGDGRSELFQTVFGAMGGRYTGKVVIGGKEVHLTDTHQALLEGLAYLPRNRKENAILKDMSILDNGTIVQLPKFVRGLFINKNQQQEAFRIQQEKLRIKMGDKYDLITSLSGGNQQKLVLAKWVMSDPKVLILDNPSQGVDVGAKEEIYGIIHRLAQEGVAIVVLSSEAQEIIRVCDSSLVMYHGRIVGHVSGEDMNEKHIMYLATGGNQSEKEGAM